MSSKVLLVCKESEAKQAYLRELEATAAEVDAVASFGEVLKDMTDTAYQGVVIDLITSIKASQEKKGLLHEILELFPVLQVRWDGDSRSIRTISSGKASGASSLAEFITVQCEPFTPRTIRNTDRKPLNFNVLIHREELTQRGLPERTVTINVSKRGCFLFSAEDWMDGGNVWLTVSELEDKTPIVGVVRWSIKWGRAMTTPGIGVAFESITPRQTDELADKYHL